MIAVLAGSLAVGALLSAVTIRTAGASYERKRVRQRDEHLRREG